MQKNKGFVTKKQKKKMSQVAKNYHILSKLGGISRKIFITSYRIDSFTCFCSILEQNKLKMYAQDKGILSLISFPHNRPFSLFAMESDLAVEIRCDYCFAKLKISM